MSATRGRSSQPLPLKRGVDVVPRGGGFCAMSGGGSPRGAVLARGSLVTGLMIGCLALRSALAGIGRETLHRDVICPICGLKVRTSDTARRPSVARVMPAPDVPHRSAARPRGRCRTRTVGPALRIPRCEAQPILTVATNPRSASWW